jgi:hypothetical protein
MKQVLLPLLISLFSLTVSAQQAAEEKAVLQVVQTFFTHLESQDSVAFRQLHVDNMRFYIVIEDKDSVRTASRELSSFTFRKDQVLKERMRDKEVVVQVKGRIATVWAPYDLWMNETFSHCGVDAFTLVKSKDGWKIASCSYTIEKTGCGEVK